MALRTEPGTSGTESTSSTLTREEPQKRKGLVVLTYTTLVILHLATFSSFSPPPPRATFVIPAVLEISMTCVVNGVRHIPL
jgi:hypothetical protein